jgi:hypothetical protein
MQAHLARAMILSSLTWVVAMTASAADKPNILVVWGDDVGITNISHNSRGVMGYETPNIDRIAAEGMAFTDYYAEQSCTAGRSSFITGQSVFRTGLSKVGLPGAKLGMRVEDPTIATVLKHQGMPQVSLERITSETRTTCCRRTTGSTSSSATSTTSTQRKSRSWRITRATSS